ncbi:MAG: rhomboid family intramembrane serine protease [Verrucomicrobiota bacterium]
MALADRNYDHGRYRAGGGYSHLTPVVKWLIVANVAVFCGDLVIFDNRLTVWGAFTIHSALGQGRVWEFLTFQFLHGSVLHVLFNMLGLFFFGPWAERWWGTRRFLAFYLLCGAAGAAFYTVLAVLGVLQARLGAPALEFMPLVGASAGIYGILVGVAVIAPDLRVMLYFPPIEMSMRQLAIAVLVIAAGTVLLDLGSNAGGEAGHLGGALLGFLLMRQAWLLNWAQRRAPGVEIIPPKIFGSRPESKLRPRTEIDLAAQTEVDRILDKISLQGFQSLTDSERATLQQIAKANPPEP